MMTTKEPSYMRDPKAIYDDFGTVRAYLAPGTKAAEALDRLQMDMAWLETQAQEAQEQDIMRKVGELRGVIEGLHQKIQAEAQAQAGRGAGGRRSTEAQGAGLCVTCNDSRTVAGSDGLHCSDHYMQLHEGWADEA